MGKIKEVKKRVNSTDGIDWNKYDKLLASGMDAEDALKEAKINRRI